MPESRSLEDRSLEDDARAFFLAGGVLSLSDWRGLSRQDQEAYARARDEVRLREAYGLVRLLMPQPTREEREREAMREGARLALEEAKGLTLQVTTRYGNRQES